MTRLRGILVSVKNYPLSPAWMDLGRPAFRDAARVSIAKEYPGVEVCVVCMDHKPVIMFDPDFGKPDSQITDADIQGMATDFTLEARRVMDILQLVALGSSDSLLEKPSPFLFLPRP